MWKILLAVFSQICVAIYAQNQEWCDCALFRENGFLDEIEPNLQNLTGGFVDLGDREECNNGDLNNCDMFCREQIRSDINANYTFESLVGDGSEHANETYGDHMCERIEAHNPSELPIVSPGQPVYAFSRLAGCTTVDSTWYTFPDSQFDPPNNLCCNADATYTPCD